MWTIVEYVVFGIVAFDVALVIVLLLGRWWVQTHPYHARPLIRPVASYKTPPAAQRTLRGLNGGRNSDVEHHS